MAVLIEVPALAVIAVIFCLILLQYAYKLTLGALLVALVTPLAAIPILGTHPFGFLRDTVDEINNAVQAVIGSAIEANQWAFHKLMHYQAYAWQEIGRAFAQITYDTAGALRTLRRVTIPALLAAALHPVQSAISLLQRQVGALIHAGAHVAEIPGRIVIRRVNHIEQVSAKALRAAILATVGAIPVAIPRVFPRIGQLEREASAAEKWVKTHGKLLTEAGIAGLVGAALARLGIGWTRCSNTSRYGKALCGMDKNLLESLITDALIVASTISLVELAESCQAFTGDAESALRLFVREVHGLNPKPGPNASKQLAAYTAGRY